MGSDGKVSEAKKGREGGSAASLVFGFAWAAQRPTFEVS
jgi:hypothetical protein